MLLMERHAPTSRRLIHPSDPWPLPGHPEAMKMEPPPRLFSHQCVEREFCELRLLGILGSSLPEIARIILLLASVMLAVLLVR
jgi:hypothetical protein